MRQIIRLAAFSTLLACAAPATLDPARMDEAAFERALQARFQYPPPQPDAEHLDDERAGRVADAAYFATFPDYERAYTARARTEARRLIARLQAEADELTRDQFTLRVSEIVALADNAHSHTGTAFQKNTRRVPVRAYWFPDGLHVLRAIPDHADLLGARVDAIDGIPLEEVYQRIRRYNGGTDIWRRQALTPVFESPGLLHAAGVTRDPVALTYSGVLADGAPFERRLEGEERGQAAWISSTARLIYPTAADNSMPSLFVRGAVEMPVSFSHPSELLFIEPLPLGGLFIGMGHGGDTDDMPMAEFLNQARARIGADRPSYAVIDLRTNSGGDFTSTYAFARELPTLVERVYVLTSGWTLSAAMHMAAALKQAAPERVTLVGEPVGDRLQFWSEGGAFVLPNTPMIVSYTAGRHDFTGRCRDMETCFWLSAVGGDYFVSVPDLDPDIEAPLTFAAYRARRDPAMEAVLAREASARSSGRRR